MTRRVRLVLIWVGLAIVCCSLIALAYAFWPMEIQHTQATLVPTLFSPP